MSKYTLVQHSGYGYGHDSGFAHAVEESSLPDRSVERVKKAGGVVFDNYAQASNAEHEENYPPEVGGMYPRVRGTFSKKVKIQGLRLYIPREDGLIVAIEKAKKAEAEKEVASK